MMTDHERAVITGRQAVHLYKKQEGNVKTDAVEAIQTACKELEDFLLAKNKAYGNSALEPVRVFSKEDPSEQIRVRLDDKLSRLMSGGEYPGDDTILDLLGYLVLLRIAEKNDE